MSRTRRSTRDALVIALLGDPGDGLLDPADLDLDAFWIRFDDAAPLHLAAGFRAATVGIGTVLPRLLGHVNGLGGLSLDDADAVIQRADRLPGFTLLAEVAKVVACFAYFSDPRADRAVRERT